MTIKNSELQIDTVVANWLPDGTSTGLQLVVASVDLSDKVNNLFRVTSRLKTAAGSYLPKDRLIMAAYPYVGYYNMMKISNIDEVNQWDQYRTTTAPDYDLPQIDGAGRPLYQYLITASSRLLFPTIDFDSIPHVRFYMADLDAVVDPTQAGTGITISHSYNWR